MFNLSIKPAPQLSMQDVIAAVAEGRMTLLDVRDPAEWAASGVAEGALCAPLSTLRFKADPRSPEKLEGLELDKPIAVYCAAGGRAGMAVQLLTQLGYSDATNVGGFSAWQAAGGPVVR